MRSLLAVAALAVVHAQQSFWPQTGGGRFRAGVWPPSKISGNVGDEGEVRRLPARPQLLRTPSSAVTVCCASFSAPHAGGGHNAGAATE